MNFSNATTTVVVFALVAIALASIGATAATTEMANETVTFDNESNLTVDVTWNESITDPANATADVDVYGEDAFLVDGDDVTNSALNATTLNGTIAEFDSANVTANTTYTVDLNASTAGTVDVPSADIADDGTVDLSNYGTITTDDEILSVTASADLVAQNVLSADPGNTTSVTFDESNGLVDGDEYRVLVTADDLEADSVTIDDGTFGGIIGGSDGSGSALVGLVVIVGLVAGGAWLSRDNGGRS
ncbi:hypothetical protein ACFOZ7_09570 [Natribaculum luteum]|uniref:PGF-CTERM sorting domain-containing protein n=1 Tax=Natribaculum luteum TaxID=1586232 RepID=A0ABD5NZ63_9EURY|nr:hypothetical protein [Natribaculum luteum]